MRSLCGKAFIMKPMVSAETIKSLMKLLWLGCKSLHHAFNQVLFLTLQDGQTLLLALKCQNNSVTKLIINWMKSQNMYLKFYNLLISGKKCMNHLWTWLLEQVFCLLKKAMLSIRYALTRYRFRLSYLTQVQMIKLTMYLESVSSRTLTYLLHLSEPIYQPVLQGLSKLSRKLSALFSK